MITTIAEHTVETSILDGGFCIDVGCLGFKFSEAMKDFGLKVIAIDIQHLYDSEPQGITFLKYAVSNKNGLLHYTKTEDPQAMFISEGGGYPISSHTLDWFYAVNHIDDTNLDILKLDCEGSEYDILSDENFKPIPKQISVEFHLHSQPAKHHKNYVKCMMNLLKYYKAIKHEFYEAHGAGGNFWDSLFIRKDLL